MKQIKYIAKLGGYEFEFDDPMDAIKFVIEGKTHSIEKRELIAEVDIFEEEAE